MKQKKKTETMKHLTDAELRQVTGGANIDDYDDITDYWEAENRDAKRRATKQTV